MSHMQRKISSISVIFIHYFLHSVKNHRFSNEKIIICRTEQETIIYSFLLSKSNHFKHIFMENLYYEYTNIEPSIDRNCWSWRERIANTNVNNVRSIHSTWISLYRNIIAWNFLGTLNHIINQELRGPRLS